MTSGEARAASGVAIIGIACRFPGASDWRAFWRKLCDGVESVTFFTDAELEAAGVPIEILRDPAYVKASPILDEIDRFDATFFELSPREAALMDPQHRLMLEVAWETFEDAAIRPSSARPTGVFVGAGGVVTSYLLDRLSSTKSLPGQTGSLAHLGNDKDFLSTRLSYKLDLTGPSLNVQTACSTSLVAVHLACQSILSGECDLALAGGATIRVPQHQGYLSRKGDILSPDGHCRAFDARAQGTIFGSGVGAVLLKDLGQALADGDHVYAVIRGTAVNNDGAGKTSYTASSVRGQARCIVEAMTQAGVSADTLSYIECHGTGTVVGDPLEIEALSRAFRTDTDRRGFCAVGSVKTNVGHLEQTAGIAALIKAALALHHGVIPPSLNFSNPNPKIDFAASPFFVNTERRSWPASQPRRAGVNALGLGGTNAFAVLEEAPPAPGDDDETEGTVYLLPFSARSDSGLQRMLDRQLEVLGTESVALRSMAATLALGRRHFPVRLGAVATDVESLRRAVSAPRRTAAHAGSARQLVFLFTGQGAQYAGMAAGLYRRERVFRETVDRCADELRGTLSASLSDVVYGPLAALIDRTEYTQPALFLVQMGLAELWRSWGIVPDCVLGHSVGEFAAAVVAGSLTLEQGLHLIAERGRLMQALPQGGGMAAIAAEADAVAELVQGTGRHDIAIAATNAPRSTVVSGAKEALALVLQAAEVQGWRYQSLAVSHPFHSPLMRPAMHALADVASGIRARPPALTWISTATGKQVTEPPDARYWTQHALRPVRFMEAVREAAAVGAATHFVEVGPGTTLQSLGQLCLPDTARIWLGSLNRQRGDEPEILTSLGRLWEAGWEPDWQAVLASRNGRHVSIPTTPFEGQRHWLGADAYGGATGEPSGLTWTRIRSLLPESLFETRLSLGRDPFLHDHRIYGMPVLPMTAGLTILLAAARAHFGTDAVEIANLQYQEALVLPENGEVAVQCALSPLDAETTELRLASPSGANSGAWRTHMVGLARRIAQNHAGTALPIAKISKRCAASIPAARFYCFIDALGLNYGPCFRGIVSLARNSTEVLTRVRLPEQVSELGEASLHPALLDACLHVFPALVTEYGDFSEPAADGAGTFLPISVERFRVGAERAREGWLHATPRDSAQSGTELTIDLALYDDHGRWLGSIEGLAFKRLHADALRPVAADTEVPDWLYRLAWEERPPLDAPPVLRDQPAEGWLILADRSGTARELAMRLQANGFACKSVFLDDPDPMGGGATWRSTPDAAASFGALLDEASGGTEFRLRGVIDLWPLDTPEPATEAAEIEEIQRILLGAGIGLVNAVAASRERGGVDPRIWIVTRLAAGARPDDPRLSVAQSTLWGLGRTAALEHPTIWGGLIDLGPDDPASSAEALLRELIVGDGEDQVALGGGARLVPRLVRVPSLAQKSAKFDPDAGYLITGGSGFLGQELARWLVTRHGVRHLYLASRRGPDDPKGQAALVTLRALGAEPVLLKADVTDADSVTRMIACIAAGPVPLRGVFHCAGVLHDGVLAHMDWRSVRDVLAPKMAGAWFLHNATREISLDHFVLFSSVLSLMGSAGQANYAAANAFLDALAATRRAEGLPALALNWGPWADAGIATHSGNKGRAIWRARGTEYITAETGWRAFDLLIGGEGIDSAAITLTDWRVFLRQFPTPPPLYARLRENRADAAPPRAVAADAILARLQASEGDEQRALLITFVGREAKETLGLVEPIDPERPLRDYGLDSLMSVTLLNRLETSLGIRIPAATMIQGPSIERLVSAIAPHFGGAAESAPEPERAEVASGQWLVTIARRARPRLRLFCFPFAGGGSAVFQTWKDTLDPGIEVVAVEPPGRLARIHEQPVKDIASFVDGLCASMETQLDRPFAFFGHCLGGLTMFETGRRLLREKGVLPVHLFVSGARPPDRVDDQGRFEERLLSDLLKLAEFRLHLPPFQQPDDVFAEVIRRFNIKATEQMLEDPELRALVLPVIRAEFQMVSNYRFRPERPWGVPITCFSAKGDPYVSRRHALGWGRFTNDRFQLFVRSGAHFAVADDVDFMHRVINRELQT